MGYLLDINVLIARVDPAHGFHLRTREWLSSIATQAIVTCPLTENGFLRIYGHPGYPGGPGSTEAARQDLRVIRLLPNHRFIPDSVTIADDRLCPTLAGSTPKQLTDIYLLALAGTHGLEFATFDAKIPAHLVTGGDRRLAVIPI